jgi:hypothetical protein
MLDFKENFLHITKDVKKLAKALAKRKLSPPLKSLAIEQLLTSKYHATYLGVFNDRQLNTIDGILNTAMRQAIGFLPNFPSEGVQKPLKEAGLGLPPTRDKAAQMGIEHLTRVMNKDTERGFTTHAHVHRLLAQFNHWPREALESNPLKLPTLRILRLASRISGLEFDGLPPLHQDNDIATSIREASTEVDTTRKAKRDTIQGQMGTKEHVKMIRQQCKPIQYSNKILKHLAPLWELGLNNWNNLVTIQHHTTEHYTLHISPTNVLMAKLPNGDKTGPALRTSLDTLRTTLLLPATTEQKNYPKTPHPCSPPYTPPG